MSLLSRRPSPNNAAKASFPEDQLDARCGITHFRIICFVVILPGGIFWAQDAVLPALDRPVGLWWASPLPAGEDFL
jgi:hypothetical protein